MIGDVVLGCKKENPKIPALHRNCLYSAHHCYDGRFVWVKVMNDIEWLLLSPKHVAFGCVASLGLVLCCIYADRMLCHEVSDTV